MLLKYERYSDDIEWRHIYSVTFKKISLQIADFKVNFTKNKNEEEGEPHFNFLIFSTVQVSLS